MSNYKSIIQTMTQKKHYEIKFFLGFIITMLCTMFVSCNEDNDVNFGEIVNPNGTATNIDRYRGKFQTYMGGRLDRDTICITDYVHAQKTENGDSIIMHNIKFSNYMPISLQAICITDVANTNGTLSLRHGSIVPLMKMSETWVPYADKTISDFSGKITKDSLVFQMNCGGLPLIFKSGESVPYIN